MYGHYDQITAIPVDLCRGSLLQIMGDIVHVRGNTLFACYVYIFTGMCLLQFPSPTVTIQRPDSFIRRSILNRGLMLLHRHEPWQLKGVSYFHTFV